MKNTKVKSRPAAGFTIVELLTVMGVIAILIGLLVPALNLVKDYAAEVQQRAQFHGIDVGLELYAKAFGSYPSSSENDRAVAGTFPNDTYFYGGAQKLAEALVGLDMLGFHPESDFRGDNTKWYLDGGVPTSYSVYDASVSANLDARSDLFLELENANAFSMVDVYGSGNISSFNAGAIGTPTNPATIVLCDEYAKRRSSGKKTGMPILYFKARTNYREQDSTMLDGFLSATGIGDDVFYYPDNFQTVDLGEPQEDIAHPLADGGDGMVTPAPAPESGAYDDVDDWLDFDKMIVNTQVTTIQTPYRAGSYILISAGKDGLYGTADDIFNFKKE